MTSASVVHIESPRRDAIDGRPAWLLRMRATDVLLCLGANDALLLPYWSASGRTARPADYLPHPRSNRPSHRAFLDGQPVAYAVYGDALFKEVCLVVARADGSRELRLSFVEDHVETVDGHAALDLVFEDALIGLRVTHRFHIFAEYDIVVRGTTIENRSYETLSLERALTAAH